MQREREDERERLWLKRNSDQAETEYEVEDGELDPDQTTVIAAADATEVLDLRDAQATLAQPRATDVVSDSEINATTVYSRGSELEKAEEAEADQSSELSVRGQKRAQKQAAKKWRKQAQVPTHRLSKPRTGSQKFVITLMWIIIIALVTGAGWFFGRGPGTIIRIPSLSGMLQSQAVAQLDDQGIPVRIGTAYDDEIAIGRVVDSQPGIGENIKKFQGVDLIVSQGPELFEVPDLTGKSLEQATTVLNEIGFQDLKTDQAYSESSDKGEVISSSPPLARNCPARTSSPSQSPKVMLRWKSPR